MHFTILNDDTLRVEMEQGQSIKAESDAVATMSHNVTVQVRAYGLAHRYQYMPALKQPNLFIRCATQ